MKTRLSSLKELKELKATLETQAHHEAAVTAERQQLHALKERAAKEFQDAMKGVQPIAAAPRKTLPAQRPLPIARQHQLDEQAALSESLSDEFDVESLMETDDSLSWCRIGIGPDVVRKLRRGTWTIQDQLDLHGARREEARVLVAGFLKESVKRGLRCVRIVHGKGRGSVNRLPVLKGKVKSWLVQKDEVLAFCQAQPQDGGSGALIVLLKPQNG